MNQQPERFTIDVSDDVLDDLRHRLSNVRWPDDLDNSDWRYGTPREYLEPFVRYWLTEYDWRSHEARMNQFEHYRVEIDGVVVHYLRRPGKGPSPMPLLLTHGWPWTFWDFAEMLDPLTDPGASGADPADAFEIIVPSLPGFGFSSPVSRTGVGAATTAGLWQRLMTEVLGFAEYGAMGGDFGAVVTQRLAHDHPDNLIGVHLTRYRRPAGAPGLGVSVGGEEDYGPDEAGDFERDQAGIGLTAAHLAVHTRDPQSLAYGLHDSPVGLAAWLLERRRNWSDCAGDLETVYTKDQLITTIMLYWVTGTIGSSVRYYWETAHENLPLSGDPRISVPVGIGVLPGDVSALPRRHAEEDTNLQHWTRFPRGGHFGPAEVPDLLVDDLRDFFRPLRQN